MFSRAGGVAQMVQCLPSKLKALSWWDWDFNSGLHSCKAGALPLEPYFQVHFALVSFGDRVSQTICPGWPQTSYLQISASQVARITGLRHQCILGGPDENTVTVIFGRGVNLVVGGSMD
jgi:hypothetical protein